MASGADQFLSSFNRIEKRLRDELDNPRNMGFSEMVRLFPPPFWQCFCLFL